MGVRNKGWVHIWVQPCAWLLRKGLCVCLQGFVCLQHPATSPWLLYCQKAPNIPQHILYIRFESLSRTHYQYEAESNYQCRDSFVVLCVHARRKVCGDTLRRCGPTVGCVRPADGCLCARLLQELQC